MGIPKFGSRGAANSQELYKTEKGGGLKRTSDR